MTPPKAGAARARIYFAGIGARAEAWHRVFAEEAPEIEVVDPSGAEERPADIHYALAWKPKPGALTNLPGLRAIFGLGAGVDGILADPTLPAGVPLIRMVDPGLTQGMVEYCIWQVLYHHRRFWETEAAQKRHEWLDQYYPAPWDRTVGVMGLGEIGSAVATHLAAFKFKLRGWSRSRKQLTGIDCFAGKDGLADFLAGCEILLCLLPLTAETTGMLNAELFAQLPTGAALINAGRGAQLNEADLLAAMRAGRIGSATLDVFQTEPLPKDHPFWHQERLFITPHNASFTDPAAAARAIRQQIENDRAGLPLQHIVDRARGY
ncbi:MAG TPA: glyoxylate/hydroxypyruvate reductase A [Dongiaceae bacterium]|nr:glyoxylate/hydroxypyruvate reductase A [Dongiaceae bacterium]